MRVKIVFLKNLEVGAVRRCSSWEDPSALKLVKRDSIIVARLSEAFLFFDFRLDEKIDERLTPRLWCCFDGGMGPG